MEYHEKVMESEVVGKVGTLPQLQPDKYVLLAYLSTVLDSYHTNFEWWSVSGTSVSSTRFTRTIFEMVSKPVRKTFCNLLFYYCVIVLFPTKEIKLVQPKTGAFINNID